MVEYEGVKIEWDDGREKFIAEIGGKEISKKNIGEIKKLIDAKNLGEERCFVIGNWWCTKRILEMEITKKQGSDYFVRVVDSGNRSRREQDVYKKSDGNIAKVKEINLIIKEIDELQDKAQKKMDSLERLPGD